MSDEEEVKYFKQHKLEKWVRVFKKGHEYINRIHTMKKEEEMEKLLLEMRVGSSDVVTDMNKNIYDGFRNENKNNEEIDRE